MSRHARTERERDACWSANGVVADKLRSGGDPLQAEAAAYASKSVGHGVEKPHEADNGEEPGLTHPDRASDPQVDV